jgi:hypothetical protein
MRIAAVAAVLCSTALSGCVTNGDVVRFNAQSPSQEAMIRDGESVIVSRSKNSVVTVRPATRQVSGRPIFIVTVQNISKKPLNFLVSNVHAAQAIDGNEQDLKIYSYEELAQEERNAQVGRAILVGVVAGANSYSAGNRYWRQQNANAQNAEMAAGVAEAGARNLADLEAMAIKDNTVLPTETYGGRLVIQGPSTGEASMKAYTLTIPLGPDTHRIQISQGPAA